MKRLKLIGLVPLVVLSGVFLTACQTANSDETKAPTPVEGSIEECLEDKGAQRALSPNDIKFLTDAEANDEVSKPGLAYDRKADIIVRFWTATQVENRPFAWIVWFGQPFEDSGSPFSILTDESSRTFVMFVDHPDRKVREGVNSCISIEQEGG